MVAELERRLDGGDSVVDGWTEGRLRSLATTSRAGRVWLEGVVEGKLGVFLKRLRNEDRAMNSQPDLGHSLQSIVQTIIIGR